MNPPRLLYRRASIVLATLALGLRAADAPPAPPPPDTLPEQVQVEGVEFARLDPKLARSGNTRVSRDFTRVATRESVEGGKRVVVDGAPGPVFAGIYALDFAPVGARYSYEAKTTDRKHTVIVDGEAGPLLDAAEDLVWSADGRHFAYRARRAEDSAWAVVRDGVVGEFAPGRITRLALSPDGAHLAVLREDENGKARVATYDGKRFAEQATGFAYSPFRWSADGSVFAYVAERPKGESTERYLVIAGEERGAGTSIDPDYLVLSDDGRHFAANIAQGGGREIVVHDGRVLGPYQNLWGKPTLSADGTRIAFVATLDDGFAHAVIDGTPGPAATNRHGVKSLRFSADGSVVGYLRQTGEKLWVLHVGARTMGAPGDIKELWLAPDGSRVAWQVKTDAGLQIVVDGRASEPPFRDIAPEGAQFTRDGRDFLYVATRDRKSFTVRVAGVGGRTYQLAAPLFRFDGPARFTFVSCTDGVFSRETWTLPR